MSRAITSSSGAIAQKRPASVMSMAMSTPASQRTSPCTRPKPESMYWVKVPRKRSMTPVPPIAYPPDGFGDAGGEAASRSAPGDR